MAAKWLDHERPSAHKVEPLFRHLAIASLSMKHLDGLHDRAELIEPLVGLGLTLSVFVLALLLLPL